MKVMKNENKNKKSKWFRIIFLLLLIVLIPLGIDWLIIGNDFPSNISNSNWVQFLGGYIGAIIGGVITLIGISWTIRFTREQNKADHELQVRPFFDIIYYSTEEFQRTGHWLGYIEVEIFDDEMSVMPNPTGAGIMRIKNIGTGPATNIDIDVDAKMKSNLIKYNAFFTNHNSKVTTNSVRPEETADVSLEIINRLHAPTKTDITWEEIPDALPIPIYDKEKFKIPEGFCFSVTIKYNDLLGNAFSQKLSFSVSYALLYKKGEDMHFTCNISLKEIEPSRIIN